MRRRVILWAVLLALALVLVFAVTAVAKPAATPHFQTHVAATLDHVYEGESINPTYGIPYWVGSTYEVATGHIDVTIDVESVSNAIGPYDDGSDLPVKWDYIAKGVVTAHVHVTDPDTGLVVEGDYAMQVKRVTVVQGYPQHYDLDVRYKGAKYTMYIGRNSLGYFVYLPFVGELIGGGDGLYGPVHTSTALSFEFNDPAVELGD